jgi:NADH-quinone oxidoreductase subunit M
MENILNWIIWFPIIGMVAIAFIPRDKENVIKITAAVATGLQFLLTLVLWQNYDAGDGGIHSARTMNCIPPSPAS